MTQFEESICYKPGTMLAPTNKVVLFTVLQKEKLRLGEYKDTTVQQLNGLSQFSFTEIER